MVGRWGSCRLVCGWAESWGPEWVVWWDDEWAAWSVGSRAVWSAAGWEHAPAAKRARLRAGMKVQMSAVQTDGK